MLFKLILLLTVVPLGELYLLIKLTQWTNFGVTVLVILGTGILGAVLARMQGLLVIRQMQEKMARGELPADSLLEAVMVLVAAALLLTPGLLTDSLGFFLLVPWCRSLLLRILKRWLRKKIQQGSIWVHHEAGFGPPGQEPPPWHTPPQDEEDEQP